VFERILLNVEDTPGLARAAAWTLKLAQSSSSRVFAVCVMDTSVQRTRQQAGSVEERAWELLYEIEDDAFQQNVKVSLMLEQGEPLRRILHLSVSYEVDLIVTSADCRLPALELVKQCARPVVFVK
jgi:nucleotide-binding universal stress UspA family protein